MRVSALVLLLFMQGPSPVVHEAMTITGSVTQFASGTKAALTTSSAQVQCTGVLETAPIRMTFDGDTPSATNGTPVAVGTMVTVDGWLSVNGFRAIRTTSTSAAIYWTCFQ